MLSHGYILVCVKQMQYSKQAVKCQLLWGVVGFLQQFLASHKSRFRGYRDIFPVVCTYTPHLAVSALINCATWGKRIMG